MPYFPDLTLHTYTSTNGLSVFNVGWLDAAQPYDRGETSPEFRTALELLCKRPIYLHRGNHICQFCQHEPIAAWPPSHPERLGNGQIRVQAADGQWYAAPVMTHHYVIAHSYRPPPGFIQAVLHPAAIAIP